MVTDGEKYSQEEKGQSDNKGSQRIKRECDDLVQDMKANEEISEKVAEFLEDGEVKLPKFYHVLKTHKLPLDLADPPSWLESNGYPVRGIISGIGGPTEKLSGFVEHFLQTGMRQLPTFMKDTKHALKIVEEINEKVESGELSLDGVGLATLDLEKMYNNMTEEVGVAACKRYLETRTSSGMDDDEVSPRSLLKAFRIISLNSIKRSTIRRGVLEQASS